MKYTKENLVEYCKGAISISEVTKKLGLKRDSNIRLRNLIREILIENNSYKGQAYRKNSFKPSKTNEEFFSNGKSKRTTYAVREALFDRGIKERICECCGLHTWNNNPIPLEVHHKDGNKYNNELNNLEILCPNCHYFTDTYKTKNRGVG